jgi:tetratricopeptide (TPR) repeat protein
MRASLAILFCIFAASLFGADEAFTGLEPLEKAKREAQAGRLDAALALLNELDKSATPVALSFDLRGSIYLEQGKLEEAMKAFRAANELDAVLFTPQLHVADTLLRQGNWEEARGAYELMLKGTNVLMVFERLRYAILLTYLGAKDDTGARTALERITFPTETPTYYYSQAAWAFAHGDNKTAGKWLRTADGIFDAKKTAWFARPLFDRGYIKTKPPIALD